MSERQSKNGRQSKDEVMAMFDRAAIARVIDGTFKFEAKAKGFATPIYTKEEIRRRMRRFAAILLELRYDAGQSCREALRTGEALLLHQLFGAPAPTVSEYRNGKRVRGAGLASGRAAYVGSLRADETDEVVLEKDRVNPDDRLVLDVSEATGTIQTSVPGGGGGA